MRTGITLEEHEIAVIAIFPFSRATPSNSGPQLENKLVEEVFPTKCQPLLKR